MFELIRRTFKECMDDDCPGLAAQLSYYFFLSVFPAMLFLLATASFFPLDNLTDDVARVLGPFVSAEVLQLIQEQMQRLLNSEIDHASPHGKPPGEKSASGRRMIGRRAARAFDQRQQPSAAGRRPESRLDA